MPLAVAEAAREFGVQEATLYRWIHAGLVPGVDGAPLRVRMSDEFRARFRPEPQEGFVPAALDGRPYSGAGRRMAVGRQRSSGRHEFRCHDGRLQRWRNSGLEKRSQLGYPQEQHEWLAVRVRPEAETFVERPGLSVDGLHDDGARADQFGRRQGAPRRVDQQV